MKYLRIYAKFVPNVWQQVKPILEKVVDRTFDECSIDDHYKLLCKGDQTLWLGASDDNEILAAGTTQVVVYPSKKVLRIILFATKSGRDLELFKPLLEEVIKYGISYGCSGIEAWVRKGFARKLKWDHEYSIISKPIGV